MTAALSEARRSGRRSVWPGSWRLRPVDLGPAVLFLACQALVAPAFAEIRGGSRSPRLNWDATGYLRIAENGYPTGGSPGVPPDGFSLYAFHPLFPLLNRVVGEVTRLGPGVVAPWVNLAAAAAALTVLSLWLRPTLGVSGVMSGTLLLVAAPAAPVFQMGYTEGLALLLLVCTWASVSREEHAAAAVSVVLLAMARPVVAPVLLAVAWHAWVQWRRSGSVRALIGPAAVMAAGLLGLLLWPATAALVSGDPSVYWEAHAAFAETGAPMSPMATGLAYPWFGALLLAVLGLAALVALKLLPQATPPVLRAWSLVYLPYISVSALMTPSLLRYALFAFPLGLALTPVLARRNVGVVVALVVLAVGLRLQWWWVQEFVPLGGDWTYP